MRFLKKTLNILLSFFSRKQASRSDDISNKFDLAFVSEIPSELKENTLYVEGDIKKMDYLYASFKCPCGCGDELLLNLIEDVKPCWQVVLSEDNNFSITPSVWREVNCKSHFWLRNSKIIWV